MYVCTYCNRQCPCLGLVWFVRLAAVAYHYIFISGILRNLRLFVLGSVDNVPSRYINIKQH